MKVLLQVLFFFIVLALIESKYEVIMDRIETALPKDKNKILAFHTFRVRKFNRSISVLTGVFEVRLPVDNSMIISFESFNLAGGQYKKIFGRTLGGFCTLAYEDHMENEVRRIFAHLNVSVNYGACPIPPQYINVNDYLLLGAGNYIPPYLPGNERWKTTLWFSKDGKNLGGFTLYLILRDNQKLFDSTFG